MESSPSSYGRAGTTLRGSLCSPSRTRPRAGAGTPSSNTASWRSSHCGRRCLWWPMICPGSPRFAPSFLMWCRLFSSFLVVNDPCSASLGARDPVPWEVSLSPAGEGHLGPAPAAKGPACGSQRASGGAERGGGGPSASLCQREGRGGHGPGAGRPFDGVGQGVGGGAYPRHR